MAALLYGRALLAAGGESGSPRLIPSHSSEVLCTRSWLIPAAAQGIFLSLQLTEGLHSQGCRRNLLCIHSISKEERGPISASMVLFTCLAIGVAIPGQKAVEGLWFCQISAGQDGVAPCALCPPCHQYSNQVQPSHT